MLCSIVLAKLNKLLACFSVVVVVVGFVTDVKLDGSIRLKLLFNDTFNFEAKNEQNQVPRENDTSVKKGTHSTFEKKTVSERMYIGECSCGKMAKL